MEVLLVGGACLTSALGAALACGGLAASSRGVAARRALSWALRAMRLLRRLSRTQLADALLGANLWRAHALRLVALLAAHGVSLDERTAAVALAVALAGLSCVTGLLMASPVAAVAAGAIVVGVAAARELSRRRRARREVVAAMPGVYRTLSVALASGQTLAQAVAYVGSRDAVALLARELDAPGAELLATALVISHRTGSPLRDLLMRSAALAERQGEFERMLGVKTAQVRLSVRIVSLLPAVMIAILALVSPDFQSGLLTPAGVGCVCLAAMLDGVALLIIRRLMAGVTRWT